MKTGIELIRTERNSQIYKHGYTKANDLDYTKRQLVKAAKFCLETVGHGPGFENFKHKWPEGWSIDHVHTIRFKDDIGKLKVAGAFYMAENDRLGKAKYERIINVIAKKIDKLLAKPQAPLNI